MAFDWGCDGTQGRAHCSMLLIFGALAVQPRRSIFLCLFSISSQVVVSTNVQGVVSDGGSCRALRSALRSALGLALYS